MSVKPRVVLITESDEPGVMVETDIPLHMVGSYYGARYEQGYNSTSSDIYMLCPACGYIMYDIPRDADNGHDSCCCQQDPCGWADKPNETCFTHFEWSDGIGPRSWTA